MIQPLVCSPFLTSIPTELTLSTFSSRYVTRLAFLMANFTYDVIGWSLASSTSASTCQELSNAATLQADWLQGEKKQLPSMIFTRYCFKVEDAASLKDIKEGFKHLRQLNISLYDCEEDSSDEEEEQEDAAGVVGRASVEVASFFLQSALQLEVISVELEQD